MPFPSFTYVDENGKVERFSKCPQYLTDPAANQLIALYAHYKHGHLYTAGGIDAQPAKYLAAMAMIDQEANTIDSEDGNE